jgi:hypothetical protein
VTSLQPVEQRRADRDIHFAQQHADEESAAHSDTAMNVPHRKIDVLCSASCHAITC